MPRPRRRITTLEVLEARRVPAAISVAPVQVVETGVATAATFTATVSKASSRLITLTYSTANGTARAGLDYAAANSSVTIPAGQTSATFSVPILADGTAGESTEKFYVNLRASAGNTVTARRVAATIVTGNAATVSAAAAESLAIVPTVAVSDATVVEPPAGRSALAYVTISLSSATTKTVRVSYATVAETATSAGSSREFQARAGVVTFQPGKTSVRVPIRVYGHETSDETFNVVLRAAANATLSSVLPGGVAGRVVIKDAATSVDRPTIMVTNPSISAGGLATFDVSLSSASSVPVSFRYATEGTSTDQGYTPANGIVTIPAGQTSTSFSIPTSATAAATGTTQFAVDLTSAANGNLAAPNATATILGTGEVSAANVAATTTAGTGGTATFTVTLASALTSPLKVGYNTVDGTAVAGTDYAATSGFLVFQPGVTSLTVPVTLLAEASPPASATFNLNLFGTNGLTLATATATVTSSTTGTGTPPGGTGTPPGGTTGTPPGTTTPAITVAAGSAVVGTSGTSTLTFTVSLTQSSTSTVTVDYSTLDGSAVAGTDYTAASGTLTFAPGVTSQAVVVTVNGENTTATSKTFSLVIANATNATITSNSITGVITYATGTPAVAVSSPSASVGTSGTGTLTFTVTLSAVSPQSVTVNYATADGTAIAGTDYTATSGTLTFAPGDESQTVTVTVAGESGTTASKTLSLDLTGATNTSNATATGTGTINYVVTGQPGAVSSNLGNTSGGAETSTGSTYNAASFTTGTSTYTLNSVDLLLAESSTGTATVEIFADDGLNEPGALVGTLASPTAYSTTAADTAFTASSGIALSASTTYWVVLVANSGSFDWSFTNDETGTGVGYTGDWAQSADAGASYFTYISSPLQMSVTATATS